MGRRAVGLAIALAGFGFALYGAWIPAKAVVAQQLLEAAWGEAQHSRSPVSAWPWADSWPVAELSFGKTSLIVLSPGGGESLAFGPALVAGSAAPGWGIDNGGMTLATVIAGHRDTHFQRLGELRVGGDVTLKAPGGESLAYRITEVRVLQESWLDIPENPARPLLILTSCWPLDGTVPGGEERYVVVAEGV